VCFLLASLLAPSSLRAEESERLSFVRLAWVRADGAEACLTEAELSARVSERLARNPWSERATTLIEGWVRRDGQRLRAKLAVRGENGQVRGERELSSEELDCAALGNAITLAVALAIDPEAALAPAEPAQEPPPAAPAVPHAPSSAGAVSPPQAEAEPAVIAVEAPRGTGDVMPRALVSFGTLPRPAAGAGLAGHVRVARRLSILGALTYLPEVRTESERAAFGLTTGTLGACFEPFTLDPSAPIDGFDGCLGAELGAIHAVSFGERPLDPGDRLWLAAAAQLRAVRQLVGRAALELGGGIGVPVLRHEFVVRGVPGHVFRTSSVNAQLFVGIGAVF
jgi:hypothetical protein